MSHKHPLWARLAAGEIILSDGAWGTELEKLGLAPGDCADEWNISHPEQIRQVAASYLAAGADLIKTNTFGGNRFRLRRHGLADRARELNAAGARLSLEAALEAGAFVAGSVGPSGEFIEPRGLLTEKEMYDAFREQMEGLQEGGLSAVLIETHSALPEMKLAIQAARELGLRVLASMTFDASTEDFRTLCGVSAAAAAEALTAFGADVVGTNCGNNMETMARIVRAMRPHTHLPILAHANAVRPPQSAGPQVFDETPEQMAPKLEQLVAAGAQIIGGCCGTTPGHIRALRQALAARGLCR